MKTKFKTIQILVVLILLFVGGAINSCEKHEDTMNTNKDETTFTNCQASHVDHCPKLAKELYFTNAVFCTFTIVK